MAICILLIPSLYSFYMLYSNNTKISTDINLWGQFGSYFGGILSPITSFVAAYLIYENLKNDNFIQKLQIMRDSISKLDEELQRELNTVIVNSNFGDELKGKKVIDAIRAYSELNIEVTDQRYLFFFSQLDSIGIMIKAVDYYLSLLNDIETVENEIKNIDQLYWISKYGPTTRKLMKILNPQYLERSMVPDRLKALNKILLTNKI